MRASGGNERLPTRRAAAWIMTLLLSLPACAAVDLTAPEDASISISANPLFIEAGGDVSTITVILSNADGTVVPDGTVVTMTATLGTISPRAETSRGVAQVALVSGSQSGLSTVTARSGSASNEAAVDVTIGAFPNSLAISADPATLGPTGGTSSITAIVFGDDGEPLANVPLTLTTDAGSLDGAGNVQRTDASGRVEDTLTTDRTATVTATTGGLGDEGPLTADVTVTVTDNEPPTAQFVASPATPRVGQTVNFNAGGSSDPDGSIVSFEWDFGDGEGAEGRTVTHAYEALGTYTVLLLVTDNDGAIASASRDVTVTAGIPPVASFVFTPTAPTVGAQVTFDASMSSDPDGRIVEYLWDWGDGTSPVSRATPTATHTFAAAGTFKVVLTVRDDLGNFVSTTADVQVTQSE